MENLFFMEGQGRAWSFFSGIMLKMKGYILSPEKLGILKQCSFLKEGHPVQLIFCKRAISLTTWCHIMVMSGVDDNGDFCQHLLIHQEEFREKGL